jgi:small ligand-binding sensory domain FIST
VAPLRFADDLPDLDGPPDAWERLAGARARENPQFVLLADPFSTRTGALLAGLDYAFPGAVKVGGLASGGTSPGTNALFLDGEVSIAGTVGVVLRGAVVVDTVVAQGCRPIGPLMQVTSCKGNLLHGLDGEPALEVLRDLVADLDERDRHLAATALFAGVLMDEFREEPRAGDFLIRNLLGVDPRNGAVAVGENLQEGMRLRFHVRDAASAAEDLHAMLAAYNEASGTGADSAAGFAAGSAGALLFSCLGRGENLYGQANFDSSVFREHLGDLPVGGFFCNGEIGPVGGATFLHGYTASFGILHPTEPE